MQQYNQNEKNKKNLIRILSINKNSYRNFVFCPSEANVHKNN